jgi:hypothetical protein
MKTKKVDAHCRLLALEVRPRRLGYAAFEMPAKLVDFGVTRFDLLQTGVRRATSWMDRLQPTMLVLRKIERQSRRDQRRTRAAVRLIRKSAQHNSIPVSLVTNKQLQACFRAYRVANKHQVASFLARVFPELAARLPRARKAWQRENWHMPIFDAAALGVTCLAKTDRAMIQKLTRADGVLSPAPH